MILPKRENVKTVAALHQQEGTWRVVVASLKGEGEVEIKGAEAVSVVAGSAGLAEIATKYGGVDLWIRVLPPAFTVVRIAALPDAAKEDGGSPAAVADALALIAESELPAGTPEFRRAAGLINPGRGIGRKPVGLLTGWPANTDLDSGRAARFGPEVCISEAAALAVLSQVVGGAERAWTVDRAAGAMTILAAGPDKTIVRVARVPGADAGADARRTAINETSRAAGLGPAEPRAADHGWLALDPAPSSPRIAGGTRTSDWLAQYGLAAAAIIAYADPSPAVWSLVNLHEIEPKAKPPVLQRVSDWFGSPRRAAAIIAVCVIAAVGLPIGVAYARVKILERQVSDYKALQAQNTENQRELDFYQFLKDKRWPMTKLLADIAGAAPVGVTIDSVDITQGPGESVQLRGGAEDSEKVTTFRENLRKTGVFSDATTPSVTQNSGGGVNFQLNAKVAPGKAVQQVAFIEDFATHPLSERMYGDTHRSRSTSKNDRASRDRADRRTSTPDSRSTRPSGRDTSRDTSRPDRPAGGSPSSSAPKPGPVPPPLTDEQIAKLTAEQAMGEWTSRKKAASETKDEALKRRLLDESEKAKSRMLQARAGGGA